MKKKKNINANKNIRLSPEKTVQSNIIELDKTPQHDNNPTLFQNINGNMLSQKSLQRSTEFSKFSLTQSRPFSSKRVKQVHFKADFKEDHAKVSYYLIKSMLIFIFKIDFIYI